MRVLLNGVTWRRVSLAAIDHALIVGAVLLAVAIRAPEIRPEGWAMVWRGMLVAGVLQICLHYVDLYDMRRLPNHRDLVERLLQGLVAGIVILAVVYYWVPQLILGRGVFVIAAVLFTVLMVSWRLLFDSLSPRLGATERLLILGTNSTAFDLARHLDERRHVFGVDLVGFVDMDGSRVDPHPLAAPGRAIVGGIADIPRLVRDHDVRRVVVSMGDTRGKLPMDTLLEMKLTGGVRFDHVASVYEEFTGRIAVENLRPSWLIFSEGFRKTRRRRPPSGRSTSSSRSPCWYCSRR